MSRQNKTCLGGLKALNSIVEKAVFKTNFYSIIFFQSGANLLNEKHARKRTHDETSLALRACVRRWWRVRVVGGCKNPRLSKKYLNSTIHNTHLCRSRGNYLCERLVPLRLSQLASPYNPQGDITQPQLQRLFRRPHKPLSFA